MHSSGQHISHQADASGFKIVKGLSSSATCRMKKRQSKKFMKMVATKTFPMS